MATTAMKISPLIPDMRHIARTAVVYQLVQLRRECATANIFRRRGRAVPAPSAPQDPADLIAEGRHPSTVPARRRAHHRDLDATVPASSATNTIASARTNAPLGSYSITSSARPSRSRRDRPG